MPHFFIKNSDINNNKISINDKDNYNHIAKSLRTKVGENLLLIDENQIQYECVVNEITDNSILAEIKKSYKSKRDLPYNLYLAQSPLNSDSQNLIIEKATELGVRGIYPIFTDNCARKKDIIINKIPKWQKIMFEASKQCERAIVPKCFELSDIKSIIQNNNFDRIIAFCERIADKTIRENFTDKPPKSGENILIIIGPEGGFSKKEFEFFRNNKNIEMLTLGDMILKADTAVVVAVGNVIYEITNNLKN